MNEQNEVIEVINTLYDALLFTFEEPIVSVDKIRNKLHHGLIGLNRMVDSETVQQLAASYNEKLKTSGWEKG